MEKEPVKEQPILQNCPYCGVLLQLGMTESEWIEFTNGFRVPATEDCPSCGNRYDVIYNNGVRLVADAGTCVKKMNMFSPPTPFMVNVTTPNPPAK